MFWSDWTRDTAVGVMLVRVGGVQSGGGGGGHVSRTWSDTNRQWLVLQ